MRLDNPVQPHSFDQGGVSTGRPAGISCPTCKNELQFATLEKCQFAGCDHCSGMLFQQPVFASLITHLRKKHTGPRPIPSPMDAGELQQQRLCTVCDSLMETHSYAGPGNSVINSCRTCQIIWFDAGELDRLVQAPGR